MDADRPAYGNGDHVQADDDGGVGNELGNEDAERADAQDHEERARVGGQQACHQPAQQVVDTQPEQ